MQHSEPLLNHPYYQEKIKLKQEEFDSKSSKLLKASNKPVVQPTVTGTYSNKKFYGTHRKVC